MLVSAASVISIGANGLNAIAQCSGYSVEIFAGPTCPIFPSFAHATGISDNGSMCGGYVDCAEVGHHVIWWPNGEKTELPNSADGGIPDSPFEVNDDGQVAGRLNLPGLPSPDRAFLFSDGVTTNLGALLGHNWAEALAINNSGVVIGNSINTATGPLTAFVWQDGKMSKVPLPYGLASEAYDISDSGKICGWMGNHTANDAHAFIHDLATGDTVDAGILVSGSSGSRATGITNAGTICGWSFIPCGFACYDRKGFIWSNGVVQELGVLSGTTTTEPQAINDSNVVVGYCSDPGAKAFVWQDGVISALNDLIPPELNLNITLAWDINNAGQIVGEANVIGSGGDRVAVRLTPIPSHIGDSDCDSDIDVDDLLGVINNWAHQSPKGSTPPALPPCDFDHDGFVEVDDLMIVIDNWTI